MDGYICSGRSNTSETDDYCFVLERPTPQKQMAIFVLERPTPQKWMTLSLLGGVTPQQASSLLRQHFSEEKRTRRKQNHFLRSTHTQNPYKKTRTSETKTHVLFQSGYNCLRAVCPALVRTLTIIILAIIKSKPNTAATRWLDRSYPRSGPDGNRQSVSERRG